MNEQQITEFGSWIDKEVSKAKGKQGKLQRVGAGWYLVALEIKRIEVFEIEQLDFEESHDLNGWWIMRAFNGYWYSDPYPTLKELKDAMGID